MYDKKPGGNMKKIFLILLFLVTKILFSQVLLTEDFDFNGNLTDNGWTAHSSAGTNPLQTTEGLIYTGYPNSGIGNAVLIGNLSGEDVNRGFTTQSGNGTTIYYSFMVKVIETATDKTGDYFIHLGQRTNPTSFTSFAARVFAKIVSNNVIFGLSNTTAPTYGSNNYSKNTTYLIVVKYTINTGGNDETKLWVFSSGIPNSEDAAGTPEVTNTSTAGQDNINAVGIRQGSNAQPTIVVDGIRIANSWNDAPLPVELASFTASYFNGGVTLVWKTATEVNNYGWEIERSKIDEKTNKPSVWEKVGFVKGSGNSNSPKEYTFIDNKALYGYYAYRLKQIDVDGAFSYSSEVRVFAGSKPQIYDVKNYPNPFNPQTTIRFELPEAGNVKLAIYDITGQLVKVLVDEWMPEGIHETIFDGSQLASGIYISVLQAKDVRVVKKMQLIK